MIEERDLKKSEKRWVYIPWPKVLGYPRVRTVLTVAAGVMIAECVGRC